MSGWRGRALRFLCRHRWTYTPADRPYLPPDLSFRTCDRCGLAQLVQSSGSPARLSLSWRYVTPDDTSESIEAWRAGTAATAPDAPPTTRLAYTRQSDATSSTTAEITPEYVYRTGASR